MLSNDGSPQRDRDRAAHGRVEKEDTYVQCTGALPSVRCGAMKPHRLVLLSLVTTLTAGAALSACVGDSPTGTPSDAGTTSEGSVNDVANPPSDGGDSGKTCVAPEQNCGGTCINTQTDKLNCGKCGRNCGTASCTAGKCGVVTVASGMSQPYRIRSMTTPNVVIVTSADSFKDGGAPGGGLFRIPKPSGAPTRMWTSPSYAMKSVDFAVDDPFAYVMTQLNNGNAYLNKMDMNQAPSSGPTNSITFSGLNTQQWIGARTTDAGTFVVANGAYNVYGRAGNDSMALVMSTGGGTGITLPSSELFVMSDESNQSIRSCKRSDPMVTCSPASGTVLYTGALANQPRSLTSFGDTLYWANEGTTWSIITCSLPTCTPKALVTGEGKIGDLAADGTALYWTDPVGGRVRTCTDLVNGCGGTSATVVDTQPSATGIAVDGTTLYWTLPPSGAVRSIAK